VVSIPHLSLPPDTPSTFSVLFTCQHLLSCGGCKTLLAPFFSVVFPLNGPVKQVFGCVSIFNSPVFYVSLPRRCPDWEASSLFPCHPPQAQSVEPTPQGSRPDKLSGVLLTEWFFLFFFHTLSALPFPSKSPYRQHNPLFFSGLHVLNFSPFFPVPYRVPNTSLDSCGSFFGLSPPLVIYALW